MNKYFNIGTFCLYNPSIAYIYKKNSRILYTVVGTGEGGLGAEVTHLNIDDGTCKLSEQDCLYC